MGVETSEDIHIEQNGPSVALVTAVTQTEVFPNAEHAGVVKEFTKWRETGMSALWGTAGVVVMVEGLNHIVSGDPAVGIQLVGLGAFFMENAQRDVAARGLANRQIKRIKNSIIRIR